MNREEMGKHSRLEKMAEIIPGPRGGGGDGKNPESLIQYHVPSSLKLI